jgi:hypothetical protein
MLTNPVTPLPRTRAVRRRHSTSPTTLRARPNGRSGAVGEQSASGHVCSLTSHSSPHGRTSCTCAGGPNRRLWRDTLRIHLFSERPVGLRQCVYILVSYHIHQQMPRHGLSNRAPLCSLLERIFAWQMLHSDPVLSREFLSCHSPPKRPSPGSKATALPTASAGATAR